jgi:ATP-binding cassette, subfamily B, multidrug efflux pump
MKYFIKLLRYLKPYRMWAVLAPLLMLLEVGMDLVQPRLIQRIVDQGIGQMDMDVVINTGLQMIGASLIGMVGGVGCTIFSILASQGLGTDLRGSLFRKIQTLSFGNLDDLDTGQLVTRLTNDVTQIQDTVSMSLRIMVRAPAMLVGSLIMGISTSPQLAPLFLMLGSIVLALVAWMITKAYPLYGQVQGKLDDLNSVMQENIAGVRVVKAFVRAAHEIKRFGKANKALADLSVKVARTVAATRPLMMFTLNMGVVAAIWFGGLQVEAGGMTAGELIAFINYMMRTLMSMLFVSFLVMRVARAAASAERVQEVLDSEPEVVNAPDAVTAIPAKGEVAFENVAFSYDDDGGDPVLKGISFKAEPGETVAILGATGSGKSSLIHLIPRFYDVDEGRITLDGVDVRKIDKGELRRNMGVALQEPVLFSGTIRDNIRYGRPEADDQEVIAAAKAAQAHEFITTFPEGYDSVVGQRGVNLSGGQKQRVAIARALLLKPAVLVLDDSTSSVDVETETEIQEALIEVMKDRTSFVVAQRISTVLNADKILVLDDGQIAAEGTHAELLASSPIYQDIYESQLGNGVVANGAE